MITCFLELLGLGKHIIIIIRQNVCIGFLTSHMHMDADDFNVWAIGVVEEIKHLIFIYTKFGGATTLSKKGKVRVDADAYFQN